MPKSLIFPRSKVFALKYGECTEDFYADLEQSDLGPEGTGPDDESFGRYLELLDRGDIVSRGENEHDRWVSILQLYDVADMLEDPKSANMVLDKIAEALHQEGLRPVLLGAIYHSIYGMGYELLFLQELILDFMTTCMTSRELDDLLGKDFRWKEEVLRDLALGPVRQREKEGKTPQKKLERLDKYYMKV